MAEWLTNMIAYLDTFFQGWYSKILVAAIILLVGFVIGKFVGRLLYRILKELEISAIIKKGTGVKLHVEKGMSVFLTYFIYFITAIMALNQLDITTTVLSMLSGAVIVIIVIAVALAIKDFVPNLFAGFYIYKNRFIKVGERIKVRGIEGTVQEISLLETKLKTKEGDTVYIPNAVMTQTEVLKLKKDPKKGKKSR